MRFIKLSTTLGYTYLGLFLVAPIVFIFWQVLAGIGEIYTSITDPFYINLSPDAFSNAIYIRPTDPPTLVIRGPDLGVIINSLWVALLVAAVDTTLGFALAYVLAKYVFPGRTALGLLATLPLIVMPFATAYVVRKFLDPRWGTLNWILSAFLPLRIEISGLAAVAIVQILMFLPIAYLNIYAALTRVDPTLEEVAANLGADERRTIRDVVLPLSTPGLAAAFVLVFIFAIDDVAAPIIFQDDPAARKLLSYQVYSKFLDQLRGQISPTAAFLALILLTISITAFLAVRKYVGLRQYAMLIRQLRPRVYRPGPLGKAAIYLIAFPLVLTAAAPLIGAIALVFAERWTTTPLPEAPSLQNAADRIAEVFQNSLFLRGVINTVYYGVTATLIMVGIGLLIALAAARSRGPAADALDALATMPIAIPGLVVAYAYFLTSLQLSTFLKPTAPALAQALDPLRHPELYLIVGYSVRKLPFVVRSIYAGLQQIHPSMEEVAMNLGDGYFGVLRKILVPLLKTNILSGALIGFVYVTSEVSLSITLGVLKGVGQDTAMPITAFMRERFESGLYGVQEAATLGLILVLIQVAAITLTTRVLKTRYGFIL
ncbi:binding-protein-dependent transport systems inner membrane component [Pyrobaculum islandicum DSM 4184]|uniref:Binding-protein-dependent transport systems inner membrane component n=1 Tax=Pyrobaculum islandicum (strain DSM 4184 / JCM 9189 / GEO3) TaxID=384616 RepID=A1RQM8_PYRIL|nr:iron ABC transporter permease [Pyrobaculum islandicum]ABL87260.1 binding-protein-dependent transport systems inner membrane component [Pyrobaculum islandicum DSM 4184]